MKTSISDAPKRRIDDNLTIIDLLTDKKFAFDFIIANLNGTHPKVINRISQRVYYILSGNGSVQVSNEMYDVKSGDLVYIPANTVHSINGELKYIVITSPPFNPANEKIIE